MSSNKWKDEEVEILKEYFPIGGYKLCQEKGITKNIQSIRTKAYSLSLYYNALGWSDDEISILRKHYSIGGYKLCQEKGINVEISILNKYYPKGGYKLCQEKGINRTELAIRRKAIALGIKVDKKWSESEIKILKEYYPKGGYKLCQEKGLKRKKEILRSKAKDLGLKVEGILWSDVEISILNKYYPKGGYKLCQEKGINRTKAAIRRKASMYFPEHIRNKLYLRNNHPNKWLTSELDILKRYYPEGGVKLCKENGLSRTSGAISGKAFSLNISVINTEGMIELKDNTWSDDELKLLNDYYPKGGVELCKKQGLKRSKSSIVAKAHKLNIKIINTNGESGFKDSKLSDDELKLCQEKGINKI